MEHPKDIKREQMKALVEKMKQEGKPIGGLPISFAEPARPAASGRTLSFFTLIPWSFRKCTSSVERCYTDQEHLLQE